MTRTTAFTGRAARARASCRSRSSTSSRRPTCGSILDLQARAHAGDGDESTLEYGVRAAASIAARALGENRNVGMTASGTRIGILPADRGPRQYQKVMQVLAAVMANGDRPLVAGARRRRRPAAARHERGDRHAVAGARLGPTAQRSARTRRRGGHRAPRSASPSLPLSAATEACPSSTTRPRPPSSARRARFVTRSPSTTSPGTASCPVSRSPPSSSRPRRDRSWCYR